MKRNVNIWAVILSAIVVLGLLVGFFFLGYFASAKGWVEIKEPDPVEDTIEDEDKLPEDGGETGGETAALKAAAYTVSLKGDVAPLKVDLPGSGVGEAWICTECGNGHVSRTFYNAPTCTTAGKSIYECDYCDYRSEEEEQALGHNYTDVDVEATCTTSGVSGRRVCSRCNTVLKPGTTIPALGHDWGDGVSVAETATHCRDTLYTCARCAATYYALSGTSARTTHVGSVIQTQESTCAVTGFKKYRCSECLAEWKEELPLVAHTVDAGKVTKYATCVEAGVKTYSCTVCGAVDHTEAIPATGHTYPEAGEGIVSKAATCTEEGVMSYICTVCGQGAYTEPIQALGHKFERVDATEPTCTEPGHGQYMQCTRCEAVSGEIMEVPATGHKWTEWEETRESCDVAGERTRTCTVCGEEESEELEAGAHSWDDGVISKAPTCTESGVRTKTCELCGDTMTETVDAVGHKPAKMAAVAATCTKTGLSEGERCTACGITLTAQQVIPALGHKMQYHAAVAATETTGGNIEYWQCSTCGVCYTDAEGKTQISAEDTLTPPLGIEEPDDKPGDEEPAEDKAGLEWWAWALIVAGAVVVVGLALVIVDQIAAKNKTKSNGNNGNNYGSNGGNRNNYNNYNGSRNHKNKSKKR